MTVQHDDEDAGVRPYLAILAVAVIVGVVLLLYVAGYRDEIMAILSQSPT